MKQIEYQGKVYTQVQKRTANKLYNQDVPVYCLPCKGNIHSLFVEFTEIGNLRIKGMTFYEAIREHEYYNCNSQLGTYSHFYIIK